MLAADVQNVFNESAKLLTGIVTESDEVTKIQKFCTNLIEKAEEEVQQIVEAREINHQIIEK